MVEASDIGYGDSDVGSSLSQLKDDIGDAWVSGKTYAVGDYCISGNRLYKCKTEHTAGSAFDAAYWDAVSVAGELSAKYVYKSDTLASSYADIVTGGYIQIKNIVIVNIRIQTTADVAGTTEIVTGFPLPYIGVNHVPVFTDSAIYGYMNSYGRIRFNTNVQSGKIIMISCTYISK